METRFDHHNGKLVRELEQQGRHASIIFEDGHRITLGNVDDLPADIVGTALLVVEDTPDGTNLVFGHTQTDGPAVRVHEVLVAHGSPVKGAESASEATDAQA